MTYPAIPFPPAAIQHTRCWLALLINQTMLANLLPVTVDYPDLHGALEEYDRTIKEAYPGLLKKKPSAGANKEMNKRTEILARWVHLPDDAPAEDFFEKLCVWMWCCSILIADAVSTCPVYTRDSATWKKLFDMSDELADFLRQVSPSGEADVEGTAFYEEIAL